MSWLSQGLHKPWVDVLGYCLGAQLFEIPARLRTLCGAFQRCNSCQRRDRASPPLIGGLIVTWLSWRWVFAVFIALGVVGLLLTWYALPETRPVLATQKRSTVAAEYRQLIASRAFIGCVVGGGFSTTAFYAFISSAPFIFIEHFHEPVTQVGLNLFILIGGISIGYFLCGRLVRRIEATALMLCANALTIFCAAVVLLEFTMFDATSLEIVATMFIYCVGAGISSPVAVTKAMSIVPGVAGSASGIFGFGQISRDCESEQARVCN